MTGKSSTEHSGAGVAASNLDPCHQSVVGVHVPTDHDDFAREHEHPDEVPSLLAERFA
jgi:hypothetical protein